MIELAYDYTERSAFEWFVEYLEWNSSPLWKHVESEIGQFGSHSNMTEATRDLVGVRHKREESIAALVGRVLALAKVVYSDPAKRRDPVVQAQLAEYFTDAMYNSLIQQDVARDSPETLDNAFALAKRSEALLIRLGREGRSKVGEHK